MAGDLLRRVDPAVTKRGKYDGSPIESKRARRESVNCE
jgi:hypothetical protein